MMLNELEVRPDVYVTHLKPGKGKRIMAEIGAYNASMPVHRLRQGWCSSSELRLRRGRSGVATKRHFDPLFQSGLESRGWGRAREGPGNRVGGGKPMNRAYGKASSGTDVGSRLAFFKGLQRITTRIHATRNIDEIIFDLSADLCELFHAERITIYTVDDSRTAIHSKVKSGLHTISTIRLPIAANSVAGYVALSHKLVNIADVHDSDELEAISPELRFRKEVDEHSRFHSKQMLVAPIVDPDKGSSRA